LFGGAAGDPAFPHNCVGRHLAMPLIHETLLRVLALPGLARDIDPATFRPRPLVKRWGAICESFPLRWQRDRRMNQQPLVRGAADQGAGAPRTRRSSRR
jgi:hypothetical protein